jgi:hypothetical protein
MDYEVDIGVCNIRIGMEASFSIVNYEVWNSELCHKIRAEWVTPAVFMPRSWAALEFRSIKGPTSTFYHSGLYLQVINKISNISK